jgi:hypothetical protein
MVGRGSFCDLRSDIGTNAIGDELLCIFKKSVKGDIAKVKGLY